MQGQRQLAARDAGIRTSKPDRFTPLLADIRKGLGDSWTFYEECIEGVLADAAKQQDTTAWFEQMQQLVKGIEKVQISHEGILFLMQEMGIRLPKQQSWGEGEGDSRKYPSLSLSPQKGLSPTSTANMGIYPAHPPSTMTPVLPLRPLRPNAPAIADWLAPRAPTPGPQQQQYLPLPLPLPHAPQRKQQHHPQVLRDGVLPFDFSASAQPGLTFPSSQDFRNYHCPPDTITTSENHLPPPPNLMRKSSRDPVFYSDAALRANVAKAFGSEVQSSSGNRGAAGLQQKAQRLPYDIHDDDLAVWRTRLEADGRGAEVKANEPVTSTWPPWNYRFDLEM